jgi:hypothetical protein
MMDYCYLEFLPKNTESLSRAIAFFGMVKAAKETDAVNEQPLVDYLTDAERAYFWQLSPEEQQEWNDEWFSTPIALRHSPRMLTPQWHLESMLDAFWNGDYELVAIQADNGKHYLTFNPHSYPYGGTGCMVGFLECFGHQVVGIQDGTGYEPYTPKTEFWKPKKKQR